MTMKIKSNYKVNLFIKISENVLIKNSIFTKKKEGQVLHLLKNEES